MRLLLDTCTFLWLIGDPDRLTSKVRSRVTDSSIPVAVSVATLWEILIKSGKGRIGLVTGDETILEFLVNQCTAHQLDLLCLTAATLEPLERLPAIHADPFDRLLICHAVEQGLTLVTPDSAIRRYPVRILW